MRDFGQAPSMVAALGVIVVAGLLVHREFKTHTDPEPRPRPSTVEVEHWDSLQSGGYRVGPNNAPLTLVIFGDYECPSCRLVHNTIEEFRQGHRNDIAIVFQHWPLNHHRFAYPAARAVECARVQGYFEPMHDILYDTQDSLGLIPFRELATRVGVPDISGFEQCTRSRDTVSIVEQGIRHAQRLNARGTPAVIANGWYLANLPNRSRLDSLVRAAKSP